MRLRYYQLSVKATAILQFSIIGLKKKHHHPFVLLVLLMFLLSLLFVGGGSTWVLRSCISNANLTSTEAPTDRNRVSSFSLQKIWFMHTY